MQLNFSEVTVESLQKYREARKAYVALGPASDPSVAHEAGNSYRVALEALAYSVLCEADRQAPDALSLSMNIGHRGAYVSCGQPQVTAGKRPRNKYFWWAMANLVIAFALVAEFAVACLTDMLGLEVIVIPMALLTLVPVVLCGCQSWRQWKQPLQGISVSTAHRHNGKFDEETD